MTMMMTTTQLALSHVLLNFFLFRRVKVFPHFLGERAREEKVSHSRWHFEARCENPTSGKFKNRNFNRELVAVHHTASLKVKRGWRERQKLQQKLKIQLFHFNMQDAGFYFQSTKIHSSQFQSNNAIDSLDNALQRWWILMTTAYLASIVDDEFGKIGTH